MIAIPKWSPTTINLLGIDPGTTKLGVSIMEVSLLTREIINVTAFTLRGDKLANHYLLDSHYGNRHSRIHGMMDYLSHICNEYQPFAIISEAPFYNPRAPGAFEALVNVIDALRIMVSNYDLFKNLIVVDPSSIKNSVGAKGGANKITIKEAVLNIPEITNNYDNRDDHITALDEHAIDSIAVNYWYYLKHLKV